LNILITGIHGFVGSNLVLTPKSEHKIYGIDILTPEKEGIWVTFGWHQLDRIPPIDIIIHLAGKAHDTKNTSSAQSYFDINLGLTQKIFDYFLQSDARKFILFSSVKAAADTVTGDYLNEEIPPNPKTPYGQSKLAAEQYITETYAAWIKANNQQPTAISQKPKAIYILRPCMIHGPGNKGNLNLLYKMVQKGIPWPLGNFNNQRSFCSIDNLTFVIQQLIEKNIPSGIYQVADDQHLATNQLVALMAESLNRKPRIWNINQNLIDQLSKAGDLLHFPLNTERLKKLTESYLVSNLKLKNVLGIEKMPINAVDGMKKTLNSFRKNI